MWFLDEFQLSQACLVNFDRFPYSGGSKLEVVFLMGGCLRGTVHGWMLKGDGPPNLKWGMESLLSPQYLVKKYNLPQYVTLFTVLCVACEAEHVWNVACHTSFSRFHALFL